MHNAIDQEPTALTNKPGWDILRMHPVVKGTLYTKAVWADQLILAARQPDIHRVSNYLIHHDYRLEPVVDVEVNVTVWTALKDVPAHKGAQECALSGVARLLTEHAMSLFGDVSKMEEYEYLRTLASAFFCPFKPNMLYFTVPKQQSGT